MTKPKSEQAAPTKPRKRTTDWEAVERDYRTAKFTLRELEAKHGADNGLISRMAKKRGWTQDLAIAIKQATNAKLIEELVSKEVSDCQHKVSNTVFAVAELNKTVILGHRKVAKDAHGAMEAARSAVMAHGAAVVDMKEAATFASAVESLSRTAKNMIEIERRAFGLDDDVAEDDLAATSRFSDVDRAVRLANLLAKAEAR